MSDPDVMMRDASSTARRPLWIAALALGSSLALAQAIFSTALRTAPAPEGALALGLATSIAFAGVTIDPGPPPGATSRIGHAALWCLGLGLGAVLLIGVSTNLRTGLVLRAGVGVALLSLAAAELRRVLEPPLAGRARALVLVGLALLGSAPLWLGPAAERWPRLIDAVVAISPLTYLAVMCDYDYLRGQWFYAHSTLGSLRYSYPSGAVLSFFYLALGLVPLLWRFRGRRGR